MVAAAQVPNPESLRMNTAGQKPPKNPPPEAFGI